MHDPLKLVPEAAAVASGPARPDDTGDRRQCGRCRQFFDDEATRGLPERANWWLCPPCRDALLPEARVFSRRSRASPRR